MLKLPSVALAAALLSAGAVSAATVSFDFKDAPSNVFTSGGVSVTATAHRLNSNGTIGSQETLGLWNNGLGVSMYQGDAHYVDGYGSLNDVVKFAFSQVVRIVSVTLSYADWNDKFSFGYEGSSGYVHLTNGQPLVSGNTTWDWDWGSPVEATYSFGGTYWSSIFGIGAVDEHSEFKIAGMTVETVNPPVVPLPAAGWGLIAGLGALVALKRRKAA
jgi:hypothetical protein